MNRKLVIYDGNGYWVGMRRREGKIFHFWSPKKADAAKFYFPEVAAKISSLLPQPVSVRQA